jgi:hypothetical protein
VEDENQTPESQAAGSGRSKPDAIVKKWNVRPSQVIGHFLDNADPNNPEFGKIRASSNNLVQKKREALKRVKQMSAEELERFLANTGLVEGKKEKEPKK